MKPLKLLSFFIRKEKNNIYINLELKELRTYNELNNITYKHTRLGS